MAGPKFERGPRADRGASVPRTRYVRVWEQGGEFLEHRDGKAWNEAPAVGVSHCCTAQTRAVVHVQGLPLMHISRCRCGGTNLHDGHGWIDRNTRFQPECERRTVMWGAR